MKWIVIIIGVLILFVYLIRKGNDKFWRLVSKYPFKAYEFFTNNDCWYIIYPNENKTKPKDGNWSGPFFVIIPGIGRLKIYGREEDFEQKEQEFIDMIENEKQFTPHNRRS